MGFPTRDRYRHRVERLARNADRSEIELATMAIDLARTAAPDAHADAPADPRRRHVGFYLIDQGLPELVKLGKVRLSVTDRLARLSPGAALAGYAAAIVLMTGALPALLVRPGGAVTDRHQPFVGCRHQLVPDLAGAPTAPAADGLRQPHSGRCPLPSGGTVHAARR
ncbi:hypothetical protein G6F31_018954 [Rhizopus arrhizus]|nr:hypothetical protein G6F31_018954 [Rhizopus arrhizus]